MHYLETNRSKLYLLLIILSALIAAAGVMLADLAWPIRAGGLLAITVVCLASNSAQNRLRWQIRLVNQCLCSRPSLATSRDTADWQAVRLIQMLPWLLVFATDQRKIIIWRDSLSASDWKQLRRWSKLVKGNNSQTTA